MFHGAKRLDFRRHDSENTFENFFCVGLVAVALKVGKFPQMCVHDTSWPLANKKLPAMFNDERDEMAGGTGGALVEIG